ncbi:unnamed protein product [Absidia cylindrospora]
MSVDITTALAGGAYFDHLFRDCEQQEISVHSWMPRRLTPNVEKSGDHFYVIIILQNMGILAHNLTPQDRYKEEAKELMKQQDQLLTQLQGLEEELLAQGIGMNEPLIDSEGYPRSDIDVAAVRHIRNQVYRLRNDHKKVMAEIETVLHHLHQASRTSQGEHESLPESSGTNNNNNNNNNSNVTEQQQELAPHQPFAKVNAVSPDSPASASGLQRNDLILRFGTITSDNHQQLRALSTIVRTHLDRPLEIKVLRNQAELTLSLTPRNGWGGRGTLGCHILPL